MEATMNRNVYLPDDIDERAKAAGLNLSGLLRQAVITELDRLDTLTAARDGMTEQTIDLEDEDGNPVRLRFTGKHITGPDPNVYLHHEGKIIVVLDGGYQMTEAFEEFDDLDEFSEWVADEQRSTLGREREATLNEAVGMLGGRRVIDL